MFIEILPIKNEVTLTKTALLRYCTYSMLHAVVHYCAILTKSPTTKGTADKVVIILRPKDCIM